MLCLNMQTLLQGTYDEMFALATNICLVKLDERLFFNFLLSVIHSV